MESEKKLILLGFCSGAIPVITEMADEIEDIRSFDIVKNVDVDQTKQKYAWEEYSIKSYLENEYNSENFKKHKVHFGVLNSHIKYVLYEHFKHSKGVRREQYLNLIHRSVFVSKSVKIDYGILVEPISVVSSFTLLGFGVTIKRSCSVGHHCTLDDFVKLNPGVVISGNVKIGKGTEIGSGATVSNHITIGKNCLIGAGSVVTKDIPDGVVAYGNPCRVIRENERWVKAKNIIK